MAGPLGSFLGGESSYQTPIPGLLKRREARPYIFEGAELSRAPLPYNVMDFYNQFVRNPYAGYQTSGAEQDLINQLFGERQAQFNNLGIGDSPAAQTSIAAGAAPALVNFRQGYAQQQGQGLSDFVRLLLGQRAQQQQGLYNAADYGKIQGMTSTGASPGFLEAFNQTFGSSGPFSSGGAFGTGQSGGALKSLFV